MTAIIRAAQTIANRSDFVRGLEDLLYSDETRKNFREVDQLHPLLVAEPWIFGDEWVVSLSESGLSSVVRSCIDQLGGSAEFAPEPVKLESGKGGRVDMVFYRLLPESERSRHLVVELKRPMRLTMKEYGQISDYATAITSHAQVKSGAHFFDFWLIGTDMNEAVEGQWRDSLRPGLAAETTRYRIWVLTWAQLIQQADRRLKAFREALELVSTEGSAREYLKRVHADFIPDPSN